MKRSVFTASLTFLCLFGTAFGQGFHNNYAITSTSLDNYQSLPSVKSSMQVNSSELITVGFGNESPGSSFHDMVVVKTSIANGAVIWARRYGFPNIDERANALTTTFDSDGVVVVGSVEDPIGNGDLNAFAMRIDIQSGLVDWAFDYGGINSNEEWRMIEKTSGNTYFLAGSTVLPNQEKGMIYVGKIQADGDVLFVKRYSNFPNQEENYVYSMVSDLNNNMILAGTHYWIKWDGLPHSHIFTLPIDVNTGTPGTYRMHYSYERTSVIGGVIARVMNSKGIGYAIACTAVNPALPGWGFAGDAESLIGVYGLKSDLSPNYARFLWRPNSQKNSGLVVFPNSDSQRILRTLDVFTSTTYLDNPDRAFPGFLRLNASAGTLSSFVQYDDGLSEEPVDMVKTPSGYVTKVLNSGASSFTQARVGLNGKGVNCHEELAIRIVSSVGQGISKTYLRNDYGWLTQHSLPTASLNGTFQACGSTTMQSFRQATEPVALGDEAIDSPISFQLYPNPIAQEGENLTLAYTTSVNKVIDISIFNALGQTTATVVKTLNTGSHQLEIEAAQLSPGLNLVTVRSEGEVLFQTRVVMR